MRAALLKFGRPAVLFAALFAVASCRPPGREQMTAQASDDWVRSYPLSPGGEIQITNGNGPVELEAADGDTVEVRAERIARAANDAAAAEIVPRITIHEEVSPDKVALRTEPLGGIVIGVSTEVRYHVRAPRAARIRVRGMNVNAKGFTGRSILTAINGGLVGDSLGGGIEARSTNGNAKLALSAFGNDLVDIRVTNGSLELTVPAAANANLNASVTNGSIDVRALRLEPLGEQSPRRVRGRLNAGGAPIDITVVNGNIVIRPDTP